MISSWIVITIAAGFASNLYNFLNRYILRKEADSTAFAWLTEATRLGIALLVIPFDFKFEFTYPGIWSFFLLSAIEAVSIFIFMKMHAFSHLSISTIIQRTRMIWIPILAFFFLHEALKVSDYAGIAVLFLGLSIAVSPGKILFDKGVIYAYLSSFVVAILSIVMKVASPLMSTSVVLIGMSYMSVVLFPVGMKNGQLRIKSMLNRNIVIKLLAGISNTVSMYLFVYALRIGSVSKVSAIYQGMMVVSILAGILFLGENKDLFKKIIGSAVTIIGVMILTVV